LFIIFSNPPPTKFHRHHHCSFVFKLTPPPNCAAFDIHCPQTTSSPPRRQPRSPRHHHYWPNPPNINFIIVEPSSSMIGANRGRTDGSDPGVFRVANHFSTQRRHVACQIVPSFHRLPEPSPAKLPKAIQVRPQPRQHSQDFPDAARSFRLSTLSST